MQNNFCGLHFLLYFQKQLKPYHRSIDDATKNIIEEQKCSVYNCHFYVFNKQVFFISFIVCIFAFFCLRNCITFINNKKLLKSINKSNKYTLAGI